MAEESDLERTEPASPKRLEQAREEGDVPRSRELATCTNLLAAGAALWMMSGKLSAELKHGLASSLMFERAEAFDFSLLINKISARLLDLFLAFSPIMGLMIIVAVGSPLLIGGWLFSVKAFTPNFERLSLINGIGNMFSVRALVELIKAIVKTVLVGCVAYIVVMAQREAMFGLALEDIKQGPAHVAYMMGICFLSIVAALVLIAIIDAPYQMWQYAQKLMMTHQEVIQESKEANGNPQIKAKIRQQQREMARRRMMSEIPTADVVITNPTHYAVALKYEEGKNVAPKVVAKGVDEVAAKIRELAKEHKVPLLEAPPLARALYKHTELGDTIPEKLYNAVAQILAYVYQLNAHRSGNADAPEFPSEIPVPKDMDPLNTTELANGGQA